MTTLRMNLKINGYKKIIRWGIWLTLGVLFLAFFIRVVTFEAKYYDEKDGSERAIVDEAPEPEEELIEVEPTKEEKTEYMVASDRPRYLSIEKLGVDKARVLPMGVNQKGELSTPNNIFDVGWYMDSGKPGQGGTMVIDGHNGGPHVHGVFKRLPDLVEGDIIKIERGDGRIFRYKIVENKTVSLADSDEYMSVASISPVFGTESVSLISCTGEWSDQQKTYLSRQFVRATLVED